MKEISYIIYQEEKYYVAQCLNADVSSFGKTIDEAINNLKEAMELYLEGEDIEISDIGKVIIGKDRVRGKENRACSNPTRV
jgi:predicted RNase H-like HicB family nuclease